MNLNQTKEEDEEVQKLIESLPKVPLRNSDFQMIEYQGFYYYDEDEIPILRNAIAFQRHFAARDTDIFIISPAKTGTAWLKCLLFAVVNRVNYPSIDLIPLHSHHHGDQFVHSIDFLPPTTPSITHLNEILSPRLLNTDVPFTSLTESIKTSAFRVSGFYYAKKAKGDDYIPPTLEDCYQDFSEGKFVPGPFFNHVRQYWEASTERSDKVLFLQYENLKTELTVQLKMLAEFIGMSFSSEEESDGIIQQIIDLCSFEDNKAVKVWEWTKDDQFTPEMSERMALLMQQKLEPELFFKLIP
ncbi:cytosolic sulfotransferase 1-like [Chenopodium quinoa]|uniref:cytosolic sulfotransferase 1-like n=1 Tax=Chenopodium quinoa TaxID=63459 RepID=UPI000B7929CD|nr:cytosolic sulfotransferase 1-like [Chenopodium quinoa]